MNNRHKRNFPAITEENMERFRASRVLVAGCGGLGGYAIEFLARAGVGSITAADGDVFTESNLNRQILCTMESLGQNKAAAAAERVRAIDPGIKFNPVCEFITKENAPALMADADIIIDCLDSIEARLMLEDAASNAGLPIVHGAINGWDLQAMLIPPDSNLLHELYTGVREDEVKTSLSMTPAACAALQVSLAIRYLCNRDINPGGILYIGSLSGMSLDSVKLSNDAK